MIGGIAVERFIPLKKMSKKKQREFYKAQRRGWGSISPVTRRESDPKAYNRAKEKRDCKEAVTLIFLFRCIPFTDDIFRLFAVY